MQLKHVDWMTLIVLLVVLNIMKDLKIKLGKRKQFKNLGGWQSGYVKPSGKFWKRYFNKRIRKNFKQPRKNWLELS